MPNEPAIDLTILNQIRTIQPPDEDLVGTVVDLFIEESARLRQCIELAVSDGDCEALQKHAHSLKSCSANVGALQVAAVSHELEHAGRSSQHDRLAELLASLIDHLVKAVRELKRAREDSLTTAS